MKTLLRVTIGLLAVIVLAIVAVSFYIDTIARRTVESQVTYALGVSTTLNGADVGILSGRFDMDGLKVSNPEGFTTPHLLRMDEGGVAVELSTLRSQTVELPELLLSGIDVNLENKGGKSNYKVVLDHLKKTHGGDQPPPPPSRDQKEYIVRKIEIKEVMVHVDLLPIGGQLTKLDIPIDRISLKDVGSETESGVLLSELSGIVVQAILEAVAGKAGDLLPAEMLGDLRGALAGLEEIDRFGMEVLDKTLRELGEAALKDIGELLGGDKQ